MPSEPQAAGPGAAPDLEPPLPEAPAAPAPAGPPRPRRLHPVSMVFLLVRRVRALWPLALVVLAWRSPVSLLLVALVAPGLLVAVALQWLRRTYTLDGTVLRVEEGVLARRQRLLPLDRIQQVSLVQRLLHRVLGVVRLRIETAGDAGRSEVDLDVIDRAEAVRLRAALLAGKAAIAAGVAGQPVAPPAAAPPERVLVRLSLGQVLLAGVTGTRAAAILAVVASASQYLDDLPDSLARRLNPHWQLPPAGPGVILLAVLAGAVLWFALAAASSVLSDYDFTLVRTADELVARRGLLDRRESTVPLARVQVAWIEEPVVRRWLGLASLRVQSAGQGGGDRVRIPILPTAELDRVLAELLPGAAPLPRLLAPPRAALRRAVVRRVVPVAVVAAAVAVLWWPQGAAAALLLPAAAAAGVAAYRSLGHALSGDHLAARRGWLLRSTAVVPVAKTQSARVTSTPFQRLAGLASLHADVAGGGNMPRVTDESLERAESLLTAVLGRAAPPPRR
jgi:putative membrane protein